jgi:hypothetical protein
MNCINGLHIIAFKSLEIMGDRDIHMLVSYLPKGKGPPGRKTCKSIIYQNISGVLPGLSSWSWPTAGGSGLSRGLDYRPAHIRFVLKAPLTPQRRSNEFYVPTPDREGFEVEN